MSMAESERCRVIEMRDRDRIRRLEEVLDQLITVTAGLARRGDVIDQAVAAGAIASAHAASPNKQAESED